MWESSFWTVKIFLDGGVILTRCNQTGVLIPRDTLVYYYSKRDKLLPTYLYDAITLDEIKPLTLSEFCVHFKITNGRLTGIALSLKNEFFWLIPVS